MQHALPGPPGLVELLEANDGYYKPELPSLEYVFPLAVVNNIGFDGRVEHFWKIYPSLDLTFEDAQEKLQPAAYGWQSAELERAEREHASNDMDVDGNRGARDSIVEALTKKSKAQWMYQVTVDGNAEKKFRELDGEREWCALRRCVVERGGVVVVWEARMYAEMQRRKLQAEEADMDGLVDFHNVCEMDMSSLRCDEDGKMEKNGVGKRRRLSGLSVMSGAADSVHGVEGESKGEGEVL